MADQTPAEQVAALLTELTDKVITREEVIRHRKISRGLRPALISEFVPHITREPGLLTQLGITVTAKDGTTTTGRSVPGGSPGWDEDGALSATRGGRTDAPEPVTDAWHVADEINTALKELHAEAHTAGHDGGLVSAAAADPEFGQHAAKQLRALVSRARIATAYDAPIATLRDRYCPDCGGPLRVRADASSAVWCGGMLDIAGPPPDGGVQPIGRIRCPRKWPQGQWVQLLAQAG